MYGASNFAFKNPTGVHPIQPARFPGERGVYAWAPRGKVEAILDCPPPVRLASEPVMTLEKRGANDPTTNQQTLNYLAPGDQDLRAHIGVTRNRYLGETRDSQIFQRPSKLPVQPFADSLYTTPTDQQKNMISKGTLANPYTGQVYELFENQLPPGDRDYSLAKTQLKNINPQLLNLQGRYNDHNPPKRKKELDGSVFKPVSARGGCNVFGPQLYTKQINDQMADIAMRSLYNNRGGDQVVEPAFANERPANQFGLNPRVRFNPYIVPTNELEGSYVTPADVVGVNTMKREEYTGAMFSRQTKPSAKNHIFPVAGPEGQMVHGAFDHVEPQLEGTCNPMQNPNLDIGGMQPSEWELRPTQMLSSLPVGMVTATVLPPVRMTDMRHTAQDLLGCLPTAGPSVAFSAAMTHGIANPTLKSEPLQLPTNAVTGQPAPAALPITTTRLGPQILDSLPVAGITPGVYGNTLTPTETMRAGPQILGTLPVGLPVGQIAPAAVPTTMTILANRPEGSVSMLPTGINATLVNTFTSIKPTHRPDQPLPVAQAALDLGGNISSTMEMRDLGFRLRDFEESRTANPSLAGAGDRTEGMWSAPTGFRGEHSKPLFAGEFPDIPQGEGGGSRPINPVEVRGRKLEGFTPYSMADAGMSIARAPDPVMCNINEQSRLEMLTNLRVANDI
jgi:hypothetical protein